VFASKASVQAAIAVQQRLNQVPPWMGHSGLFRIPTVVANAPIDDTEIVARFQEGDTSAFSLLFERHQPAVARLIARMLGESYQRRSQVVELEDLVQDVFVQVYRSLGAFRGNAKVTTWIYRIAVNVVLMHRRSARARPMFYPDDDVEPAICPNPIADEEVMRRTNIQALYRLLSQLSEKKRTVYILHEIEGLSASEVADIVGAPVLTVRTRLFYARRELLTLLRDDPHLAIVLEELQTEEDRVTKQSGERRVPLKESSQSPESQKAANDGRNLS
jgi:RNA polymerase sigma-70 factor (ECF subfamily)